MSFKNKDDEFVNKLALGQTNQVCVNYSSKIFPNLSNDSSLELVKVKGNYSITFSEKNVFEFDVLEGADTIEFDVYLKSDNFIFVRNLNESRVVDKILLCRFIEYLN